MDTVGHYQIIDDFRFAGGGRCQWTFAKRDGSVFFLKRFLKPKQFIHGSPGGPATKRAMEARCAAFESRQLALLRALAGKSAVGGNLIGPLNFFSHDGMYYKITEKVESTGLNSAQIARLHLTERQRILKSAANGIRILHSLGIVHGDVKSDNIIIRTKPDGTRMAALIDFDDSYFSSSPPRPPEEFVFDPQYASPEVFRFISDSSVENGKQLKEASDIFSLGIVFYEYVYGSKPTSTGGRGRYLGETLASGGRLNISEAGDWPAVRNVIAAMLRSDPTQRPSINEVLSGLQSEHDPSPPVDASKLSMGVKETSDSVSVGGGRSRLVINLKGRSEGAGSSSLSTSLSTLRGTLAPKKRS